jgi:Protein of unknown function (DUF3179)
VWSSLVDGRRLRFRLAGINNQNFIMQDEETGSWWQQVTGRAIFGPLKGRQLVPIPHDQLTFATWKAERPQGRVLKRDATLEEQDEYEPADWERRVQKMRTVTTLPTSSPLPARALVAGIEIGDRSKAFPIETLHQTGAIVDVIGDVPVLLVLLPDEKSVRAFDRRVAGRTLEFVRAGALSHPILIDLQDGGEWEFTGRARTGPLTGATLPRIEVLLDYWFDWLEYHPKTEVYRTWQPRAKPTPAPRDIPPPPTP